MMLVEVSPFHWENVKCQKLHDEEFGSDFAMVIKEFFQFYNMDYSNCVFASEANSRTEVKRDQLIERLGLTGKVEAGKPILTYIIEVRAA